MTDLWTPALLAAEAGADAAGSSSGLVLIAGLAAVAFVVGHATRRFMSEVIVFMVIGIVVGPEVLDVVDRDALTALEPVISVALGAIVFGIGEQLELPNLRQIRHTLLPIAILENVAVFGLVFVGLLLVGAGASAAFLLAAIALSTSPTTLVAVIGERRARGGFTDHLLALTAVNNVVSAVVYGLGLPVVLLTRSPAGGLEGITAFAQLILVSALVGGAGAFVLRRWMDSMHRAGERLLFVLITLVTVVAVSRQLGAPVVIATIVMGALTANDPRDTRPLFHSLKVLEAPIFLVFFLVAGAGVHLAELADVGLLGLVFVAARLIGKIGGAWGGTDLTRSGRRSGWAAWMGLGLQPFAGMAIGLAAFTLERAREAGLEDLGNDVSALVLGSVVVFELLGPVAVGKALDATGESGRQPDVDESVPDDAPHLIRHILAPVSSPEMARRKGAQLLDLAASTGATVTGLHVIPPGGQVDPNVGDPALSYLGQISQTRGVAFDPVVVEASSIVDAIVEEARRAAVDLVVLGEPVPRLLDRGGNRRIVHDIAGRLPDGVRVLIVPTTIETRPEPAPAGDETVNVT